MPLDSPKVIKASLGLETGGAVHSFFTETCYKHMDKYVPYKTGNLAYKSAHTYDTHIDYDAPYAAYQYYGLSRNGNPIHNIPSAGHQYAGAYWDERMVSAELDDVVREVQNRFF